MALVRTTALPVTALTSPWMWHVNGHFFVIGEDGSNHRVYATNDNGTTWFEVDAANTAVGGVAVLFFAGGYWFFKRAGGDLHYHTDLSAALTSWTEVTNLPAGYGAPNGIASDGTTWVFVAGKYAAGPGGPYHAEFIKSTNLSSWTTDIVLGGVNWPYGAPLSVGYHDRRWFLGVWDPYVFSGSPVRSSVLVSSDLTTWVTGVTSDTQQLYRVASDRTSLYAFYQAGWDGSDVTDRIYRWNRVTKVFDSAADETNAYFGYLAAGFGGSAVTIDETDPGDSWSLMTDGAVYRSAGWDRFAIGTPDSPVDLVNNVNDWAVGDTGIMFVSLVTGTAYVDFQYAEELYDADADDMLVTEDSTVGDDTFMAFGIDPLLIETANPDETLTPTATGGTSVDDETIEADEVLTDEWLLLLHETGTADDLLTPSTAAALTLEDDGEASDAPTLYFAATLTDEFLPSTEELTPEYALWQTETATADELLTPTTAFSVTLEDAAEADDAAYLVHGQDVNDETITAYESLLPTVALLLADQTITADEDLIEAGAPSIDTLVETATADDLLTVTVASLAEIIETATATDTLLAKDATAVAWVLNPDTTAAYWYSNFQFTDAVQVGDKLLAVGPDGLCVLTGNTDAGENIDAAIQTGMMDFGSEQKKRIREFRYGLTGGPMTVTAEVQGQITSYTYAMPAAVTGLPRNARIVPGQGLNSRYWRLTLENSAGAHFDVRSTVAEIAVHTRRL